MPRAEAGTTKAIANQMKSKGLQRLRWYCSACSRQMRDENGFKCHVASESHVRNMMAIGEDPRKAINEFSNEFKRDFIQLLRTSHGEKSINANRFYNEYIANKQHIHMNATKWNSLTEFCKYLGREGICRVDLDEKNEERGGASALMISWIDNSPEAMRRQEALRKKERQDRGDEHREQRLIEQQIQKAREAAGKDEVGDVEEEVGDETIHDHAISTEGIKRIDGEKIRLNFQSKKSEVEKLPSPPPTDESASPESEGRSRGGLEATGEPEPQTSIDPQGPIESNVETAPKVSMKSMSLGAPKPKNVFATGVKKNAFGSMKKAASVQQQRPMSEAERIMKEEIERKRQREDRGSFPMKKQRIT